MAELVNQHQQAGWHTIEFQTNNKVSGVYFYKIMAGSYTKVQKMMLLK